MERPWVEYLYFAILLALTIIGLGGNLLSFLVFTKGKSCGHSTCSGYFQILSVVDTLIILIPQLNLLMMMGPYGHSLESVSSFTCSFTFFCSSWLVHISLWIVVTITIERALSVSFPLKFRDMASKKRAYIVCLGVALGFAAIDFPLYFAPTLIDLDTLENETLWQEDDYTHTETAAVETTMRIINGTRTNLTEPNDDSDIEDYDIADLGMKGCDFVEDSVEFFGLTVTSTYDIAIYFIFTLLGPLTLTILCNAVIVFKLRRRVEDIVPKVSSRNSMKRRAEMISITRRVIAIGTIQCITISPLGILGIIDQIQRDLGGSEVEVPELLDTALWVLYYSNYCLNVVLYAAFGQDFRKDAKQLFHCS